MLITLKKNLKADEYERLEKKILSLDLKPVFIDCGSEKVCIVSGDTAHTDAALISCEKAVKTLTRLNEPYPLASRRFHPADTPVKSGRVVIGGDCRPVLIAGPCAVENEEQLYETAIRVKASGADILRAGAYKPRTSPYSFQGLGEQGLKILIQTKNALDMPAVSEITEITQLELFDDIDIIQVGARNMQNFEMLKELAGSGKPIILKRAPGATVTELLMSAEYLLNGGADEVVLCERGIRTFETELRYTPDIAAIPLLKQLTHLPVIFDASHSAGRSSLVKPLAMAATAAGSGGIMVEVHTDPASALSDGAQALSCEEFDDLACALRRLESVL